jgi:hypothetical protein
MANHHSSKFASPPAGSLSRPHYEEGNYLASEDLRAEQDYRQQRLRRHNRHLHGWGRVCGLRVVPAHDVARPWGVMVCPGYAITCCGDELQVCCPSRLDIRDYLWSRPQIGGTPAPAAYIGIRFTEEQHGLVAEQKPSCLCDEATHPSRLRDSFQIDVLWDMPPKTEGAFDLCSGRSAPCPTCGENPYIILAVVDLPKGEGQTITLERIHNLV